MSQMKGVRQDREHDLLDNFVALIAWVVVYETLLLFVTLLDGSPSGSVQVGLLLIAAIITIGIRRRIARRHELDRADNLS